MMASVYLYVQVWHCVIQVLYVFIVIFLRAFIVAFVLSIIVQQTSLQLFTCVIN